MPEPDQNRDDAIREAAYYIWVREGRPVGRAYEHWLRAIAEIRAASSSPDADAMDDDEKVVAGRPDANIPALLTRDTLGG